MTAFGIPLSGAHPPHDRAKPGAPGLFFLPGWNLNGYGKYFESGALRAQRFGGPIFQEADRLDYPRSRDAEEARRPPSYALLAESSALLPPPDAP